MNEKDAALIAAWRSEQPQAILDEPALARLLSSLVERGRQGWPDLMVPAERFVRRLARQWQQDEPIERWLSGLHVEDLYLACACEERAPGALEAFDRAFLAAVPAIIRPSGAAPWQADEIAQRVRERLFVGGTKIADYSGYGALAHWVQVVTLRIAIDLRRQEGGNPVGAALGSAAVGLVGIDPELEVIKERFREPVERAFRAALAALSSVQRNLLRLHFVKDVPQDDLASLFHVHRVTISRRIAAARQAVLDDARNRIQAELELDREELDNLMGILQSRIDISLSVLL